MAASGDEARLAAYEVATAMLLKRSLRNGSISAPHSIHHRSIDDQLMPVGVWVAARGTTTRRHEMAGLIGRISTTVRRTTQSANGDAAGSDHRR